MIVQALKQMAHAFGGTRGKVPAMSEMFFEVQLIGDTIGRFGAAPLSITTTQPHRVADELMRDRNPREWGVSIRPLGPRRLN